MKCSSCGDENYEGAKFCRSCGAKLTGPAEAPVADEADFRQKDAHSYKCPSCGAPLAYSAEGGKLHCSSCDNDYDIEAIECAARENKEEFNWGQYKNGLSGEKLQGTVVYSCKSCGANIEADANTAATHCPYCDNEIVIEDRVDGGLKPNAIIPFKIDKKQLPALIKDYFKGKRLLPSHFFDEHKIDGLQGIYVPFWLFDAKLDGSIVMNAELVSHYNEGKYSCTKTSYFMLEREGSMDFSRVPADGSVRMNNDLMDSVEPFDFSELVDFDSAYLSGFVADRFDSDPDAELPRVTKRMLNSAVDALADTADGYTGVSLRSNGMDVVSASVKYALLPVYLLNCHYNGKLYRFAVNGQTGKVVGELPISKLKSFLYFIGSFAGGFAAAFLIALLLQ